MGDMLTMVEFIKMRLEIVVLNIAIIKNLTEVFDQKMCELAIMLLNPSNLSDLVLLRAVRVA